MEIHELAELEDKRVVPIKESENLWLLLQEDISESLAKRFARLFREVWAVMPTRDLLEYWGSEGPFLELAEEWIGCDRALATTCRRGTVIYFGSVIHDMPDEVAKVLIAHELAHAYQYATDRDWALISEARAENDVARIIGGWGFDQTLLNHWQRWHGYWSGLCDFSDFRRRAAS